MRRLFVATLAIPPCPTRHGGSLPKMRDEAHHHWYVVYVHFCTTARRILAPFLCVNGGHPLLVLDLTHTTQLILCDRMNEGRDEGASQDREREGPFQLSIETDDEGKSQNEEVRQPAGAPIHTHPRTRKRYLIRLHLLLPWLTKCCATRHRQREGGREGGKAATGE